MLLYLFNYFCINDNYKFISVSFPISINFTKRLNVGRNEYVLGMTKLRNKIYILCKVGVSSASTPASSTVGLGSIRVFEDQNSFRFEKEIEISEIEDPSDIGSSENENCLYVSEAVEHCVWKITMEDGDDNKIRKWLIGDNAPHKLSACSDGHLLVISNSSALMIYGSDANLIRTIQLPTDMKHPLHALKTFTGNFIILHKWRDENEVDTLPGRIEWERLFVVSELSIDGKTVVRRFIPSNGKQKLNFPAYLALDADDGVFVSDNRNDRVIHLDSNLQWNRVICPTHEEHEKSAPEPKQLYYDEGKTQLIVRDSGHGEGVLVYTFSRT